MPKANRLVLIVFTFSLLVAFSPSKIGQLFYPFAIVVLIAFTNWDSLMKVCLVTGCYFLLSAFYYVLSKSYDLSFSVLGVFFFFLHIMPFFLLMVNFSGVITPRTQDRIITVVKFFILFEGIFGLGQMIFYTLATGDVGVSSGDIIRGTLQPNVFAVRLSENMVYSILMSLLIMFYVLARGFTLSVVPGVLAVILANSMSTILILLASILVTSLRVKVARRVIFRFALPTLFLLVMLSWDNISRVIGILNEIDILEHQPKVVATRNTINISGQIPAHFFVGFGPGQYSSRASLIASGQYLKDTDMKLPYSTNEFNQRNILSPYLNRTGGSFFMPSYTFLSIYGEFGFCGLMLLSFVMILLYRKYMKSFGHTVYGRIFVTFLFSFFIFLGFYENNWEYTAFTTIFVILLRLGWLPGQIRTRERKLRGLRNIYPSCFRKISLHSA